MLRGEIPFFPTSPKFHLIAHSPDKDVAIAPIINCNFIYLLTNQVTPTNSQDEMRRLAEFFDLAGLIPHFIPAIVCTTPLLGG